MAMSRLNLVVPMTLLIISLSPFTMFNNLRNSFLLFSNLLLVLSGGIALHWLQEYDVRITSAIGCIALFGVAMLNGVVLIEHINHLRKDSRTVESAVVTGTLDRLHPVRMSARLASLGFIPMALHFLLGSEMQSQVATGWPSLRLSPPPCSRSLFFQPTIYGWRAVLIRNVAW